MKLFPIGTISNGVSYGSYVSSLEKGGLFEPNGAEYCFTRPIFHTLITTFGDQIIQARQKADPHILITYYNKVILDYQYQLIERFLYDVRGIATSFYAVSWDRMSAISSIQDNTSTWDLGVTNDRYFTTTTGSKANYAIVWQPTQHFRLGAVSAVSTGSITIDASATSFGDLSSSEASGAVVCPVYNVFFVKDDPLSEFSTEGFSQDSLIRYGGPIRSGNISFVGRYTDA